MQTNTTQAQHLMAEQNYKAAIPLFTEITEQNPDDYNAWHQLGMCKFYLGQSTKDKELLQEAFNEVKHALAIANKAGESLPEAEKDFRTLTTVWERDVKPFFEY